MEFSIKACDWSDAAEHGFLLAKADCLAVGVYEAQTLSGIARVVDDATKGLVKRLVKAGDLDGKIGSAVMLHDVAGIGAARLLLVGLGKQDVFGAKAFGDAARAAWRALGALRGGHVAFTLAQEAVNGRTADWAVRHAIVAAREQAYRFTQMKSKPDAEVRGPKKITLTVAPADDKAARLAAKQGAAIGDGMDLTRDLANLPGNVCTPSHLADAARGLAREFGMKAEVLGPKQIAALKMGSFLSVAKGSVEPPQFIVLHYNGAGPAAGGRQGRKAPLVLVGKGITFDSGGISLKPGEGMDEMKYDMCGAASVLGTLRAAASLGLKLNVIGVIPTCENMPAGNANKPGDIVTSMSGQTIEVLNTDAEGRLILCDALTYVERFKPAAVIDVATLTGACVIALGHHNSGLYSKHDDLAAQLLDAARQAADPAWRMPLDDEYNEQLKSNFADVANIGGRPAGSVTAACFLARFTEAYPWAHLDIAGTAWKSGAQKGATGRPVPLLTQFLIDRAADRAA